MHRFTPIETKRETAPPLLLPILGGGEARRSSFCFNEHAQMEKMKIKQKKLCWWLFSPHQYIPDSAAHKAEQNLFFFAHLPQNSTIT